MPQKESKTLSFNVDVATAMRFVMDGLLTVHCVGLTESCLLCSKTQGNDIQRFYCSLRIQNQSIYHYCMAWFYFRFDLASL